MNENHLSSSALEQKPEPTPPPTPPPTPNTLSMFSTTVGQTITATSSQLLGLGADAIGNSIKISKQLFSALRLLGYAHIYGIMPLEPSPDHCCHPFITCINLLLSGGLLSDLNYDQISYYEKFEEQFKTYVTDNFDNLPSLTIKLTTILFVMAYTLALTSVTAIYFKKYQLIPTILLLYPLSLSIGLLRLLDGTIISMLRAALFGYQPWPKSESAAAKPEENKNQDNTKNCLIGAIQKITICPEQFKPYQSNLIGTIKLLVTCMTAYVTAGFLVEPWIEGLLTPVALLACFLSFVGIVPFSHYIITQTKHGKCLATPFILTYQYGINPLAKFIYAGICPWMIFHKDSVLPQKPAIPLLGKCFFTLMVAGVYGYLLFASHIQLQNRYSIAGLSSLASITLFGTAALLDIPLSTIKFAYYGYRKSNITLNFVDLEQQPEITAPANAYDRAAIDEAPTSTATNASRFFNWQPQQHTINRTIMPALLWGGISAAINLTLATKPLIIGTSTGIITLLASIGLERIQHCPQHCLHFSRRPTSPG